MIYKGKGGLKYELPQKPLTAGGEGEIYTVIGQPKLVAKIYKYGKASLDKERKLVKMVSEPPSRNVLSQIAWPQDVLYDNNKFIGFIMPKMDINEDLNVIYEYGTSAKYPHMAWENRILIAQNLCAVLDSVHNAGHVCGDFNPKNISVNPNTGHIMFLDTDSYHILDGSDTYRCDVGIPEYLAAEVQVKMRGGGTLVSAKLPTFSKDTDNFALAIHIFQLLMNGVHPFACAIIPSQSSVTAPQPSDNIVKGEFPFMVSIPGIKIPAYAPPISILPKEIQEFFERAFVDGHFNPSVRPSPSEWHMALENLRNELKTCKNISYHQYYQSLTSCPWCDANNAFAKIFNPKSPLTQKTIKTPMSSPLISSSSSSAFPSSTKSNKKMKKGIVLAIIAVMIITGFYFLRDITPNILNNDGSPRNKSIDMELEASTTAYQNGLQALANRNYPQAISELRKVITRDENFTNAQDKLDEAVSAYKNDVLGSLGVLEASNSYKEIISRLNTALELIPADNELLSKLTYYNGLMYEYDKDFVLGRITEIVEEAEETGDFKRGLSNLSTLLRDYPAFGMEIGNEINKLTEWLVNSNIETIMDEVSASGNFDDAITKLKILKNDYPSTYETVINDLINQYTMNLLTLATFTFDENSIMLESGGTTTISFKTTPENIINLSYIWDSTDTSVVSVDNGRVTARGFGVSEIRLKSSDGTILATCHVSVNAFLGKDIRASKILEYDIEEYPNSGSFSMQGIIYTNGITFQNTNRYRDNSVIYNIGGKYNYLCGLIGKRDDNRVPTGGIIEVYGDNRLISSISATSDVVRPFSINIAGVEQLKFVSVDDSGTDIALANVILTNTNIEMTAGKIAYGNKAILGTDIKAFRLCSVGWGESMQELPSYSGEIEVTQNMSGNIEIDGNKYYNAIFYKGQLYTFGGISTGYYNLSKQFSNVSGKYGFESRGESQHYINGDYTIKIYGDGKLLMQSEINLYEKSAIPFSLNVTNVEIFKIEITPPRGGRQTMHKALALVDVVFEK